jgi:hypothetical protein
MLPAVCAKWHCDRGIVESEESKKWERNHTSIKTSEKRLTSPSSRCETAYTILFAARHGFSHVSSGV